MFSISMISGGIIISFVRGGVFAIACWIYIPFLFVYTRLIFGQVKSAQIAKMKLNGALGGATEEALSAIKLIQSFAQEEIAIKHYDEMAQTANKAGKIAVTKQGFVGGNLFFLTMGYYIFCLSIGSIFI